MPKKAEYHITWSQELQAYEITHAPFCFPVRTNGALQHWLTMAKTFHVCSQAGHTFTLRKETKQRGGGYWYGYKRVEGRLEKKYIGDNSKVTLATLEAVAHHFAEIACPSASPPPASNQAEPKRATLPTFEKTLHSALHIYGFTSIPDKKTLLTRYRDLSKAHHPDTGGVHEDMVAVNLAYDYLKKFV